MNKFQLSFIMDKQSTKAALTDVDINVEMVQMSEYTPDSESVVITLLADSLHDFVAFMSYDENLEDWRDIILEATIVAV